MDYKINKKNFYTMLEKVLNYNYDEKFEYKEIEKDIISNVVGVKHICFIENDKKERLFQSEYYEIFKEKNQFGYVDREYKNGDKFILSDNNGVLEKVLSKDIFDYPILDILPATLKAFLEGKSEGETYEFSDADMLLISMVIEKYNCERNNAKTRALNTVKLSSR